MIIYFDDIEWVNVDWSALQEVEFVTCWEQSLFDVAGIFFLKGVVIGSWLFIP